MNDVGVGLMVASALYGFRHGFDFDHLAAIGDITGSSEDRRRSLRLSSLYVAGHALVVLVLGLGAVTIGVYIPPSLDVLMGRVIGITLVALGVYLAYAAARYGSAMRFRSRWMLAADGARALAVRLTRRRRVVIEHDHPHSHDGTHAHKHDDLGSEHGALGKRVATVTKHAHVHTHVAAMPVDPFKSYTAKAAFGVGMIHGIGAETPSQVLLFASAAGAGSLLGGTSVLLAFLIGLVAANSLVALATASGFATGARMPRLYLGLAVVTALFSLALGISYLLGRDHLFSF